MSSLEKAHRLAVYKEWNAHQNLLISEDAPGHIGEDRVEVVETGLVGDVPDSV